MQKRREEIAQARLPFCCSGKEQRSGVHGNLPNAGRLSAMTFSLRKEVIQPQVLLRLPCYDFTPIMNHTLGLFD